MLQDVERVAACMPGAKITERVDDQHYKGSVAVRFGPANMSFRGEIEVAALEPSQRTLRLIGRGTDSTGGSGASLDLTAQVEAVNDTSCNLIGTSEVSVSGKAAAFGGRMAESVAEQVLKQFAANFATALQAAQPAAAAAPPATGEVTSAPAASSPAGNSAAAAATPSAGAQLNALSVIWGMIGSWLRSLFQLRGA